MLGLLFLACAIADLPEYAAFALGALMREAYANRSLPSVGARFALLISVVLGGMMNGYGERLGLPVLPRSLALGEPHNWLHLVAAAATLYAVLNWPSLDRVLRLRPIQFLGRVSFGLYLIHVPLLYTAFVPFAVGRGAVYIGPWATLLIFLPTALLVAYLFTALIDEPTVATLHAIKARLSRPTPVGVSDVRRTQEPIGM